MSEFFRPQSVYPLIRDYERPVLLANKAGIVAPHLELSLSPYASSPNGLSVAPKARTNFPETWIWQSINLDK